MPGVNEAAVDRGGIGDKSGTAALDDNKVSGSAEMEHDATVINNDPSDFTIKSDSRGILFVERRLAVDATTSCFATSYM